MDRRPLRTVAAVALVLSLTLGASLAATTTVFVGDGSHLETDSDVDVTLDGDYELASGNPFTDQETLSFPEADISGSNGNVTVVPSNLNGTTSDVTSIETDSDGIVIVNPNDKQAVGVSATQTVSSLSFRDINLNSRTEDDLVYQSAGTINLTIYGLDTDINIRARDRTTNDLPVVAADDVNSTGAATLALPSGTQQLAIESFDANAPEIVSTEPNGDVTDTPIDIRAMVDDDDMPADNVTLTLDVDGSQVNQTTISSEGNITHEVTNIGGGQHTWTITAEDKFGLTTSETIQFGVPDHLRIYNESSLSVIDGQQVDVTFFENDGGTAGEEIVTRSTNNGTVPMRGLDVAKSYVLEVSSSGYTDRQVPIRSVVDQTNIYLAPTGQSAISVEFQLDDNTGRYPASSTALYIQRPLAINGTTQYATVQGDTFGAANSLVADLVQGDRYRLVIRNQNNETRVLGSYTPEQSVVETLTVGEVQLTAGGDRGIGFNSRIIEENGQRYVKVTYWDPEEDTDDLNITIAERGNASNVLVQGDQVDGPFGLFSATYEVPASAPEDISYLVTADAARRGLEFREQATVGDVPELADRWNIDPLVLEGIGWVVLLALTGLVVIVDSRAAAVVAVVTAFFGVMLGVLPIDGRLLAVAGVVAFLFAINGGR